MAAEASWAVTQAPSVPRVREIPGAAELITTRSNFTQSLGMMLPTSANSILHTKHSHHYTNNSNVKPTLLYHHYDNGQQVMPIYYLSIQSYFGLSQSLINYFKSDKSDSLFWMSAKLLEILGEVSRVYALCSEV